MSSDLKLQWGPVEPLLWKSWRSDSSRHIMFSFFSASRSPVPHVDRPEIKGPTAARCGPVSTIAHVTAHTLVQKLPAYSAELSYAHIGSKMLRRQAGISRLVRRPFHN